MSEKEYIQKLLDELVTLLPSNWEEVVLHGAVSPGTSTILFYARFAGNPAWFSYYDLQEKGVYTAQEYRNVRIRMGRISIAWQASGGEDPWSGYMLRVNRNGDFSVDYEYGEQEPIITWPITN